MLPPSTVGHRPPASEGFKIAGFGGPVAQTTYCETPPCPPIYGRMDTMTVPTPAAAGQAAESGRTAALIDVLVTDIETVAGDTNVYTFRRSGGGRLPPYKPGAHIDLDLPNGLI